MGQAAGAGLERWLKKYTLFANAGYLLVGLGGGLAPTLKVGDAVLCTTSQGSAATPQIQFDQDLTAWIQRRLPDARLGQAVTCDRILTQAAEKARVYQQSGASVVEMESLSIFEVLQEKSQPMAMLRVISDDCRHNMPDITTALRSDGSLAIWPLTFQLIQQPIAAGRLVAGSLKGLAQLEDLIFQLFQGST
jgi:purine-nucleoside phosphorylase